MSDLLNAHTEALVRALPHIQRYQEKTLVVKYGGNAMINPELKAGVIQDMVFLTSVGIRVILVHGGGPEIDALLKALGKESRFVQGLRYTDEETMDAVQMVLCGRVNKDITGLVQQAGGRALGLCGVDMGLFTATRLRLDGEDIGLVGEIVSVNAEFLETLLDAGIIPVISSVAQGIGEDVGRTLNINADTAAAHIAVAVGAETLLLMTDVPGLLRDVADSASRIDRLSLSELAALTQEGVISKGMIPKTECCALAIEGGVEQAHILDGRLPHSLLAALFTDQSIGTIISE